MPVYDVAANQVLAKPVSSFMQGRAMQIALQSEKLKNTAMEQEIGAFDAREARAERQLQVNEKTVDIAETNAEANLTRVMTDYQKHLRGLDADALEEQNRETTQAYSLFEDQGEEAALNFLKQNSTEEEFQQFTQMAEQVGGVGALLKSSYEAIKGVVGGSEVDDTAGMQNADRILEVMRDETLSDTEKSSMVKSLGGHIDSKGGITLDYEVAEEIAAEIMDSEDIGESGIFQSNDPVAQKLLAAEFMRLLKQGGMDVSEVKKAAIESVTKLLQKEETPQAPKAALEMLYSDYDNLIDDFEAKYGYRPEPQ